MPGFRTMCGRPEQYEDVNVLSAQMQDYFEEKGEHARSLTKIRKSFVLLYFFMVLGILSAR